MQIEFNVLIGRPRLRVVDGASGLSLVVEPPRSVMLDMASENARWLLHNGTAAERAAVVALARDIIKSFGMKPSPQG